MRNQITDFLEGNKPTQRNSLQSHTFFDSINLNKRLNGNRDVTEIQSQTSEARQNLLFVLCLCFYLHGLHYEVNYND
jgi:hypothetical protein